MNIFGALLFFSGLHNVNSFYVGFDDEEPAENLQSEEGNGISNWFGIPDQVYSFFSREPNVSHDQSDQNENGSSLAPQTDDSLTSSGSLEENFVPERDTTVNDVIAKLEVSTPDMKELIPSDSEAALGPRNHNEGLAEKTLRKVQEGLKETAQDSNNGTVEVNGVTASAEGVEGQMNHASTECSEDQKSTVLIEDLEDLKANASLKGLEDQNDDASLEDLVDKTVNDSIQDYTPELIPENRSASDHKNVKSEPSLPSEIDEPSSSSELSEGEDVNKPNTSSLRSGSSESGRTKSIFELVSISDDKPANQPGYDVDPPVVAAVIESNSTDIIKPQAIATAIEGNTTTIIKSVAQVAPNNGSYKIAWTIALLIALMVVIPIPTSYYFFVYRRQKQLKLW